MAIRLSIVQLSDSVPSGSEIKIIIEEGKKVYRRNHKFLYIISKLLTL